MSFHASRTLLRISVLALCALPMHGQTANTGAIAGTVSDPSGALVPRAAVVINNQETGEKRDLATDAEGNFSVHLLPPGNYDLTVHAPGFEPFILNGVHVQITEVSKVYPWPGNIRELQNVIERSVIVCEAENFSVDESWLSRQPRSTGPKSQLELSQKLASQEKEMIEAVLSECGGRVFGPSGAAAKLGMPRSTLESKIRSLKINKKRFKAADSSKSN
jgi:hypothetical protein